MAHDARRRKDGPLVLSEHGAKARNPLKDCATAVFAPQRLTPVERPTVTIRFAATDNRPRILHLVTGFLAICTPMQDSWPTLQNKDAPYSGAWKISSTAQRTQR